MGEQSEVADNIACRPDDLPYRLSICSGLSEPRKIDRRRDREARTDFYTQHLFRVCKKGLEFGFRFGCQLP